MDDDDEEEEEEKKAENATSTVGESVSGTTSYEVLGSLSGPKAIAPDYVDQVIQVRQRGRGERRREGEIMSVFLPSSSLPSSPPPPLPCFVFSLPSFLIFHLFSNIGGGGGGGEESEE